MTLAPERPLSTEVPPRRITCVRGPMVKHPENMRHEYLVPLLGRRKELKGTRAARLIETLIEAVEWSV